MISTAQYKYALISAQKARLVADQVRGLRVDAATTLLRFSPHKAAGMIKKTLDSAIANAEHNAGADIDDLLVGTIYIDEGPTQKRMRARAKGRGDRILKRSCHITIGLKSADPAQENAA